MSEMKTIFKAVLPKGFSAGGVACGLKRSGKLDLALFVSAVPAAACGMFTTNKIKAAPVVVCQKYLSGRAPVRAIIANSGNANCFTGAAGLRDAYETSRLAADELGCRPREVLVASTGIIGKRLAMGQLRSGIPALARALSPRGIGLAKQAIMTTDKFTKEISVVFTFDGKPVTLCGVAKGSALRC
jgi:glutamate N-acetyltransferase/amino-acid N-acetyltransferase